MTMLPEPYEMGSLYWYSRRRPLRSSGSWRIACKAVVKKEQLSGNRDSPTALLRGDATIPFLALHRALSLKTEEVYKVL